MWNKCGMWNDLQQPIDHSFSCLVQHNCDEWNFLAILFGTACHSAFFQPLHITSQFLHFCYIISTYKLLVFVVRSVSLTDYFQEGRWGQGTITLVNLNYYACTTAVAYAPLAFNPQRNARTQSSRPIEATHTKYVEPNMKKRMHILDLKHCNWWEARGGTI